MVSDDLSEFQDFIQGKYDIIIAGSDEIWRLDGFRGFPTPYFLPDSYNCIKVSYAASSRNSFSILNKVDKDKLINYLDDFSYIGVRDNKTLNEINKYTSLKNKVYLNSDPTFVYDFKPNKKNGIKLLKKYYKINYDEKKKVIGVMYRESLFSNNGFINHLTNSFKNDIIFISLYDWNIKLRGAPAINPFEWIDLIAAVDGIISMYFHGICLSIIAGTPFFGIEPVANNTENSKIYDILEKVDKTDYYAFNDKTLIQNNSFLNFIDEVINCANWNFDWKINQIRDEFDLFVNTLKEL
ncbi:MAG: polysaccharide pyruvyl transferase family protein [Erysipelotrichaceae bacterium]|nr:polysaccharide pyruvyl transferase family protein [Erysipelotrichaceae bacterium]